MPSRIAVLLGVGLLGICPPSAWANPPETPNLRQQLEALQARVAELQGSLSLVQAALATETGYRIQGDAALQQALSGLADQIGDTTLPPGTQVVLVDLEGGSSLTATLRRIQFEKKVAWTPQETSTTDPGTLVFNIPPPPTVLFVELGLPAPGMTDASPAISQLQALAQPIDPNGSEDKKRPPRVKFVMGAFAFEGVVGALVIKTGEIGPNGERLSAIAEVTLLAASRAVLGH